ncbi:MAG: CotH kinase family protein [Oscillospiraceae bacterium]|nr:CotH kinase family protein [Oscillospiraceae bacterium]
MSAHKSIDKICIVITALTLLLTVLFCNGQAFGIGIKAHAAGYENRLFDRSRVHELDIVMNDWDSFLETCENEEYSPCAVVIDGEAVRNVGIRAKGNTSLSSVRNMNSSRYSFKIEFDQYENGKSYHGLDKVCLNNIIQDNTYMKDYLAYSLMYDFGVDAPLCSFVYITVNGEDWGLYLAVEAIEDSFLSRNYGSGSGDLYKPDAMSFGGGRGNGKDFRMSEFMEQNDSDTDSDAKQQNDAGQRGQHRGRPDFGGGEMPDFGNFDFGNMPDFGDMPQFDPENMPEDFDPSEMFGKEGGMPDFGGGEGGKGGFGGGFGMGSSDVKLQYTDDEISSYSNIFNNAKTTVTEADQKRLIASLKALSEQSDLESTVDTDEVLRYFVVHLFLQNGDSYTGQMIHNYYLYEQNGQLSMIPWDYNLAYGSFSGGNASSSVNAPIDTPLSGDMSDRPMIAWIFDSEEYLAQYHQLFSEFINSVDFEQLITDTAAMIDSYVQKDPTKFCTYEDYQKGVAAIKSFCTLRAESVKGQLSGTIPSTTEGQRSDSSALIETGDLNISDMGSMGMGGGFGGKGGNFFGKRSRSGDAEEADAEKQSAMTEQTAFSALSFNSLHSIVPQTLADTQDSGDRPARGSKQGGGRPDFGGQMPEGFDPGNMPEGFDPGNMPEGFDPENMPEDFSFGNMPEGFDPENMPSDFANGNPKEGADTNELPEGNQADRQSENDGSDHQPEKPASDEQSADPSGQAERSEQSRPQFGSFPDMNAAPQNQTTAYILLGVSALVLLLGLGFALKFKR